MGDSWMEMLINEDDDTQSDDTGQIQVRLQPPDYTILAFVACIFNPVFGMVAWLTNRRAKILLINGRYSDANTCYLVSFTSSLFGIYITGLVVFLLLVPTMIPAHDVST
ncbi:hypothetical protein SNE40_015473 [Patella caerulea]|uniref:Uncharacterized protein n=1 Tax=Patella caerulea TaxID=87958 RepID=A0AAN8JI20_PATCE